jgi:hypothetical protein
LDDLGDNVRLRTTRCGQLGGQIAGVESIQRGVESCKTDWRRASTVVAITNNPMIE